MKVAQLIMKNNRNVEVGQVRDTRDLTSSLYMITKVINSCEVEVVYINGKLSGLRQVWGSHHCRDDIVVM